MNAHPRGSAVSLWSLGRRRLSADGSAFIESGNCGSNAELPRSGELRGGHEIHCQPASLRKGGKGLRSDSRTWPGAVTVRERGGVMAMDERATEKFPESMGCPGQLPGSVIASRYVCCHEHNDSRNQHDDSTAPPKPTKQRPISVLAHYVGPAGEQHHKNE